MQNECVNCIINSHVHREISARERPYAVAENFFGHTLSKCLSPKFGCQTPITQTSVDLFWWYEWCWLKH